ncbi:hypothetical protein CANCADRAFT_2773 [Tortispora caseinolytica NRRL Y-17796]|uniref:Mitochondrial import inner membrane translocase subunit TIM16 n=1 Tax=Tortispora caseinolytica NRRL Y-17796 TaxID=767744 RepID=A0A1E4TH31_9ASCO|nr:hypothetical protein CANCADRAFT_2773 [Tortispora caseinolytica NRRL Y-17796]
MAHRLIARVVITGSQVFGKAVVEAFKQASKVGAGASQPTSTSATGLSIDEAMKILNIEKPSLNKDNIEQKYSHLFEVNSKEKGGSPYVQNKVSLARERLLEELKQAARTDSAATSNPTTTSPPPPPPSS